MAQKALTPNQVVAHRLWEARTSKGWSQQRSARELAEWGFGWSKATYSAAEASRDPAKTARRFSADEILAFALTFGKPLSWFLTPPEGFEMALGDQPLHLRDVLELGLHRDLGDLRPIAERLREVATAIEVFEEGRQPEPAAAAIVRQATSTQIGDEFGGETGKRRLTPEVEAARQRRIEMDLDPDDPATELPEMDEEKGTA